MLKRFLAMFLAMTMVVSMLPTSAFAAEMEDEETEIVEETEAPAEETEPETEPEETEAEETEPEETEPEESRPEETEPEETEPEETEPELPEESVPMDEPAEEETILDEIMAVVASGNCGDNLAWTLDDNGTLTISGTGAMYNYSLLGSPWNNRSSSVKTVVIEDGVTSIGSYAFYKCSSLTSVTIPEGVTSIGSYAFYYCSSLTSVTIPDSVTSIGDYAFEDCSSLTSVSIGSSVTSIGSFAFSGCSSLTSVTIPDSVTSIGDSAFDHCSGLTSVTIPEGVTSIGSYAFYYCSSLTSVTIPDSVTSIGSDAFRSCSSLTSVSIGSGVTSIGYEAFESCSSLTSVSIGSSVTSIGSYAFRYCSNVESLSIGSVEAWCGISFEDYYSNPLASSGKQTKVYVDGALLENLVIPDGVTKIKADAFYNWDSITSATIPDSVTSIGSDAFRSCSSLTSVSIGSGVTSIGNCAFYDCSSLTSVTIPDSVTSIGSYAFRYCSNVENLTIGSVEAWCGISFENNYSNPLYSTSKRTKVYVDGELLENLVIPDGITEIKQHAFRNWDSITAVTIPESVTSIGSYAFCDCSSLTSVTIPDSVTSIGSYAFYYCSLGTVRFLGNLPQIASNAFVGVAAAAVYPAGNTTYAGAGSYGGSLAWHEAGEETDIWAQGSCGSDATWTVTANGKLTIRGTGAMSSFNIGGTPWYAYRNAICSVQLMQGITSVESSAFYGFKNLRSVVLPSSVTSIGDYAFEDCSSLTSVTIPDSVTSIGYEAFCYCRSLTAVTIPARVTSIGSYAFKECSGLQQIRFLGKKPSISTSAFSGVTAEAVVNLEMGWKEPDFGNNYGKLTWKCEAGNPTAVAFAPEYLIRDVGVSAELSAVTLTFTYASGMMASARADRLNGLTAKMPDTSRGGTSAMELTVAGKTVTIPVYVLEYSQANLTDLPESRHPFLADTYQEYTIQKNGARSLKLTFTADTNLGGGTLTVMDGQRNAVIIYTGASAAGKTVTVTGDAAILELAGDGISGAYGFRLQSVVAEVHAHAYSPVVTAPTCVTRGFTTYTCMFCTDSYVGDETDIAVHTYDRWQSDFTGHWQNCTVCGASSEYQTHIPDREEPTNTENVLCSVCGYLMQDRYSIIEVSAPARLLSAGSSMQLSACFRPWNYTDTGIIWSVSDTNAASVSTSGRLTAKSVSEQRTVTVTAASADGRSVPGTVEVTICPAAAGIAVLQGSTVSVNVNEQTELTLTAQLLPVGSIGRIVWSAGSNVSSYGSFRDNSDGTCTMTGLHLISGSAVSFTLTAANADGSASRKVTVKLVSTPRSEDITVTGPEILRGGTAGTYKAAVTSAANFTDKSLTWKLRSQDTAFASITSKGKLTTKTVGEPVEIVIMACAKAAPDSYAEYPVLLVPGGEAVEITADKPIVDGVISVDLAKGKTLQLSAAVAPDTAIQEGTWKSSSAKIARVDAEGLVTFYNPGTVKITFTASDGSKKTASVKIIAGNPAQGLTVSGASALVSGGKTTLTAAFSNIPTVKTVVWSSSDASLATVTAKGVVTAKTVFEEKTVTITAKAADGSGEEDTHTITVSPKADVLTIRDESGKAVNNSTVYVDLNSNVRNLTAPAGTIWTSSAPKVAVVNDGVVHAINTGSATITAKSADGTQTGKVTVKISALVTELSIITDTSAPMISGKGKLTLKTEVNAGAAVKTVVWSSSDPTVAAVSTTGVVSAKAGVTKNTQVTIRATAKDGSGKFDEVTVTVIPAAKQVNLISQTALTTADGISIASGEVLNGRTITLSKDTKLRLGAMVYPNQENAGADQNVTWKSSSAAIAFIGTDGVVTVKKAGSVTITVKTADGKTNTVKLKFV